MKRRPGRVGIEVVCARGESDLREGAEFLLIWKGALEHRQGKTRVHKIPRCRMVEMH